MKFGSLKNSKNKNGDLCVVSRDLSRAVRATSVCPDLLTALESWDQVFSSLQELSLKLERGDCKDSFVVKIEDFQSALPRTWLFADGSAFIQHIKLVRKARNAALPETLLTVPLMYQAECGQFLAPTEDIPQRDFSHGTDFEAEVGVIVKDTPMGISPEAALDKIALVVLINDVSLRGLIPDELAAGFGFFQSKPASALSPFAVTVDELNGHWKQGRVHLPLHVQMNGQFFGSANAGEMHFHFGQLIAHAAKTRNLVAGTLIGSGTVANEDTSKGSSCLAEKRTLEQIQNGKPSTSFMKDGDSVEIWMSSSEQKDIFGKIHQKVRAV